MTLQEYISFWQETYDKHQSRPTTYAAHNYVFKNHILPSLGDIPLSELTSERVGEFLEERRRFGNHRPGSSGLGEETMRHIHRLLQQCLDQAIRDGLLTANPAKAFRYRKSTTVKANIMTPLEMEDYLDAAERLGYLPMFMLALTAGLRQGELIALKWSDLDIENRTLTIAENRAVVRRELVEYGSQTRTIALTPKVIDLLIREHDKHPSSPLMFMHPATLKPYSPQMVRRMHDEIIKEAGIDHIRYVDLRHPYVKHTTKIFSLRLMDFQAQAYPDARRKTRGACQLHRGGQSQSPVRPLCNRKQLSCLLPQSKMSWILYAISMRLSGYTSTRSISSSASSVVSVSASKSALDASLRLSCRACSSCFCFACANTAV